MSNFKYRKLKLYFSESGYLKSPYLIQRLEGSGTIVGVTALEHTVFVIRERASCVEVYSSAAFIKLPSIPVENLCNPTQIIACYQNSCLYISNERSSAYSMLYPSLILKVPFPQGNTVKWAVDDDPKGLCVTRNSNLLVTFSSSNIIKEFTPDGVLVNTISTKNERPIQIIQTAIGNYIVTTKLHIGYGYQYNLCTMEIDGTLSSIPNLADFTSVPTLAVDGSGHILLFDANKRSILFSNSSPLKFANELNLSSFKPVAPMYLDDKMGRLYVAAGGGQLLVVKLKAKLDFII